MTDRWMLKGNPLSRTTKKETITFEDFSRIDIRVGRITEVKPIPHAGRRSYKVEVDLGDIGYKWSKTQIVDTAPEKLIGSLVAVVANLPPKNNSGFKSEVLILGARNTAGEMVVLTPRSFVRPGGSVF